MPIHIHEPLPVPAFGPVPTEAPELAPGEFVFAVLGDVVRELEPDVLMALVGAIQRGDPWPRLPLTTRNVFAELDSRLFDEEG